jgi:RNA polymerase sigma-70 factor (ECF subfamily)
MDDDTTLLSRALEGDTTAFELLVRRHADRLWRLARSVVQDDQLAEEVVQDTFLKAHANLATFRSDATVGSWLASICYHAAIDRVRLKQLDVVSLEAARHRRQEQADNDLRLVLAEIVEELPDDEREAFTLVHVLGYSREEAASIVNAPASTIRSRVARACTRLADALVAAGYSTGEALP